MFNRYPYTNFHELNLDYFIQHFNEIFTEWEQLYNELQSWKTDTTEELDQWRADVEEDLDDREAALRAELEIWKQDTADDISEWETATLNALDAWKTAATAQFEAIRIQAAASAEAAATSQTAAASAAAAALLSETAAEEAAAAIQASAAQIQQNADDIDDIETQLNNIRDVLPDEETIVTGTNYNEIYVGSGGVIRSSEFAYTEVFEANAGDRFRFTSESYSTAGGYSAVAFSSNAVPVLGESVDEVLANGASSNESFNFEYTAETHGYIYVTQHPDVNPSRGLLTTYKANLMDVASKDDVDEIDEKYETITDNLTNGATSTNNNVTEMLSKMPKDFSEIHGETYENLYVLMNKVISTSSVAYTEVFEANPGDKFRFTSESYSTAGGYPAVSFSSNAIPVRSESVDEILAYGASSNESFSFEYTAETHGYIYVTQHPGVNPSRGLLTTYKANLMDVASKDDVDEISDYISSFIFPLKNKKIAVIGDSIMQYMSGGYGGANTQTFVENGNSHTYDEITITNGIPYYNGIECTVVNEKQSYYDNQGWDALKNITEAEKILNCSIGGSVIAEGTISTPFPGYESGTHHTNSLPNLVKWLFRMCENSVNPDMVIIWMGTNGLGSNPGNLDDVFAIPWATLNSAEGHEYRQNTYGALRYAIEKIYREMPHTYIMILGPIQADSARFAGRTYAALTTRTEQMKEVAERISIKFFDPVNDIEIYGNADTATDERYLTDGLHPNENGKKILTDYLNKKIIQNYQTKY